MKSRFSIKKRQREAQKNERRLRKAERAAAKRDQPAETPAPDSVMQIPGSIPPSEAPDFGLRDHPVVPPGLPGNPVT